MKIIFLLIIAGGAYSLFFLRSKKKQEKKINESNNDFRVSMSFKIYDENMKTIFTFLDKGLNINIHEMSESNSKSFLELFYYTMWILTTLKIDNELFHDICGHFTKANNLQKTDFYDSLMPRIEEYNDYLPLQNSDSIALLSDAVMENLTGDDGNLDPFLDHLLFIYLIDTMEINVTLIRALEKNII